MTDEEPDQSSITDFLSRGEKIRDSSSSGEETGRSGPPAPENPSELLDWLQSNGVPSSKVVETLLPELVCQIKEGGEGMWSASNCINILLDGTATRLDSPEVVRLLDEDLVETRPVIEHVLRTYPIDKPSLEYSLDTGFTDDLKYSDRMKAYQALSRLPPGEAVYSCLSKAGEELREFKTTGNGDHNIQFLETYAMRCFTSFLKHPDESPREVAHEVLQDELWRVLRIVAANPDRVLSAEIDSALIERLDGAQAPPSFHQGRILPALCDWFVKIEDQEKRRDGSQLIRAIVESGILPSQLNTTLTPLVDDLIQDHRDEPASNVVTALLKTVPGDEYDQDDIKTIYPLDILVDRLPDAPRMWARQACVIADRWPLLFEEYIERLVSIARRDQDRARAAACEALAANAEHRPAAAIPEIESLVNDLSRVESAQRLADVGRILRTAGVYPPPPRLRDLYGSTDPEIDAKAKEIVADLRREFRDSSPVIQAGDIESLDSLSQNYTVVRREGEVTWESPQLNQPAMKLIRETARLVIAAGRNKEGITEINAKIQELTNSSIAFENCDVDSSLQYVVPTHDSEWVVYTVLGAVIALLIEPEIDVVLHTPATNGWGTKKDVRSTLRNYGFVSAGDDKTTVTPILDLVPSARLSDGELVLEDSATTISSDPPRLLLTRNIGSVNEATADVILYNYFPGIDAVNGMQLSKWRGSLPDARDQQHLADEEQRLVTGDGGDKIANQASLLHLIHTHDSFPDSISSAHPDDPLHVEVHGLFSMQNAAGRRQHIGPPVDLPAPRLIQTASGQGEQEGAESDSESHTASPPATSDAVVDFHAVNTDAEIGKLLSRLEDYRQELGESDAAWAVRSFRYTVGSLPVPVKLHDMWIQNQLDQGNTWVPRRLQDRRNGIQALANEATLDAQILDEALVTIDTILDELSETNPLFERLLLVLDEAATEEKQVGILCAKKTYKDMLARYLEEQASDWVQGDDLLLLDEETIRSVRADEIDWLVTFDVLPPQTAIYYHHPAVTKTIVLGHADGDLSSRVYGIERRRRPYLPVQASDELPELDVTVHGADINSEEDPDDFTDDLYRTFLSVAAQSRTDDHDRNSDRSPGITTYQVEFEDAPSVTRIDVHPVVVRTEEHLVSTGEYAPRSLSRVGKGDEMVLISRDARADLWEEFLRQHWGGDEHESEQAFMDAVQLWYDAVESGLYAHTQSDDLSGGVRDFAAEIEPEVSVAEDAIKDWARSVYRADSASELVFRKDLRIGSLYRDGVETVAVKYGSDRMADNWEEVFKRIKTIRATHRQQGSAFWEWLAKQACSGDLFNQPGVSQATVKQCREKK